MCGVGSCFKNKIIKNGKKWPGYSSIFVNDIRFVILKQTSQFALTTKDLDKFKPTVFDKTLLLLF